jgi:phage tail protein X
MSRQYRTVEGDTVDLVAYKFYGTQPGATEAILNANNGLASLGPILPLGTVVIVPDIDVQVSEEPVQLWD